MHWYRREHGTTQMAAGIVLGTGSRRKLRHFQIRYVQQKGTNPLFTSKEL
jgi:hypothetical protein